MTNNLFNQRKRIPFCMICLMRNIWTPNLKNNTWSKLAEKTETTGMSISSACVSAIRMDMKKEAMETAFVDLRRQMQSLERQNEKIKLKLDEETKKNAEMTKLSQNRRPFKRTATGEVIFPGKKEMAIKLKVMANETLKLKTILDGFQRGRCQIDSTRDLLKSVECSERRASTEDLKKSQLVKELDEQYNQMKDVFDECLLEISKYRVKFDEMKNELSVNEKRLEQTQIDFNEANFKSTQIDLNITNESNEKDRLNLTHELDGVNKRLDDLKSGVEYQMDELNEKTKMYMDAIHLNEYESIRYHNLCKEKTRLTSEFETEYNRAKEYCRKQIEHLEYLPFVLKEAKEQLTVQKNLKTSAEKTIKILKGKLKTIAGDTCMNPDNISKELMKLKAKNTSLKMEWENMEKVLANVEHCYEVTKQRTKEQNSQLNEIKNTTEMKINELRNVFKRPTEEYICTIDRLQTKIAKIKAYSCFEDRKQKLVSSAMQEQIDALAKILKDAQVQITEIESLQKHFTSFTGTKVCNVSSVKAIE